jgi:hypothetical protein
MRGPPVDGNGLLHAEQHQQHDEFEPVQRAKHSWNALIASHRPGAFVLYLAARLLDELPFKLAWAAGADRPSGGARGR